MSKHKPDGKISLLFNVLISSGKITVTAIKYFHEQTTQDPGMINIFLLQQIV